MAMTLDEAIAHAREVGIKIICSKETKECGKEHLQLAKWLEELKMYKKKCVLPKEDALAYR